MSGKISPRRAAPNQQGKVEDREHGHSVQFYSDDKFLVETLSRFVGSAVGAGDAAVVIATAEHRSALAERLAERGIEVERVVEQGRYVALDASETLSQFMVDGWPDERKFVELVGGVISRAKSAAHTERGRVALFGEMVALLWGACKMAPALRLEQLGNQIARSHSLSIVCAYPMSKFYREEHGEMFRKICNEHSKVLPSEEYSLAADDERERRVAQWQQKAQALETEVANGRHSHEAASRLAAIVESSDDAIASKDLNGIIQSWNAAAERMFGWKAEEIVGKSVLTIIPPELHKDEDVILSKLRRGERIEHFETVRMRKDGTYIDVSLSVSPIRTANGKVIGASKIVRDITEKKRAEEALRRAEKLAATGQLAATIAHEINNPMQSLTNLLALISYKTSTDSNTRELIALAESELARVSHITRQMLSFYRESPTPIPVKITEVLEDVLELFVKKLHSNEIRVERRYDSVDDIYGYPVELRQLFANLVVNAMEAIGQKGEIRIRVHPWREMKNGHRHGVRVLIADKGPGINPALRRRIFEPFFTTKEEKGTGLGLWVVKGVVSKHDGGIRMRTSTRPGRSGTVFSIFLPQSLGSYAALGNLAGEPAA